MFVSVFFVVYIMLSMMDVCIYVCVLYLMDVCIYVCVLYIMVVTANLSLGEAGHSLI